MFGGFGDGDGGDVFDSLFAFGEGLAAAEGDLAGGGGGEGGGPAVFQGLADALPFESGTLGLDGVVELLVGREGDAEFVEGAVGAEGEGALELEVVLGDGDEGVGVGDDAGLGFAEDELGGGVGGQPGGEVSALFEEGEVGVERGEDGVVGLGDLLGAADDGDGDGAGRCPLCSAGC